MNIDDCEKAVAQYGELLANTIKAIPYRPAGILPTELLLFVAMCLDRSVTVVVESGRKHGYSTDVLSHFRHRFRTISIESSPVMEADSRLSKQHFYTSLKIGDGVQLVPQCIAGRCAVLLDGPKGRNAFDLADSIADRIVLFAIHDIYERDEKSGDVTAQWRIASERQHVLASHIEALESFHWLDNPAWQGTYRNRNEATRHSSGLGLFPGGIN